jgi:hypothetical protein
LLGFDIQQTLQNLTAFGYSIGKSRVIVRVEQI